MTKTITAAVIPDPGITARLTSAPAAPGVYWMEGRSGRVLYVGKSLNIRDRLRSHFHQKQGRRQKVQRNLHRVREIHWITTDSETEALVLEESLIREHRPSLNVSQPHYRFLCITAGEPFPRFQVTEEMKPGDGSLYFGPYPDRAAMERLYSSLMPLFRIRGDSERCEWDGLTSRKPCHCFDFGWCSGPCGDAIASASYRADAQGLSEFLKGGQEPSFEKLVLLTKEKMAVVAEERRCLTQEMEQLAAQMKKAAKNLQFENAAGLRDRRAAVERRRLGAEGRLRRLQKQIAALEQMNAVKAVVQPDLPDMDAWGIDSEGDTFAVVVLPFRGGRLQKSLQVTGTLEMLASTLRRHYKKAGSLPPAILAVSSVADPTCMDRLWRSVMEQIESERQPALHRESEHGPWSGAAALARLNVGFLLPRK